MSLVNYVDHLLRNREQVASDLQDQYKVGRNTSACFWVFGILSMVYGFIMGSNNLIHGYSDGWKYSLASGVKMPILFLLTLVICLPLLYVLNVLIGPRAQFKVILGLLMSSIAVTGIILGACAPIVMFFMLSTKSYEFILLLNVAVFTLAGAYGVWFLSKGMYGLMPCMPVKPELEPAPVPTMTDGGTPLPVPSSAQGIGTIMKWWLVTYGIVGTQMAWILRPFVGTPDMQFSFFRAQESNFYMNVGQLIIRLLS